MEHEYDYNVIITAEGPLVFVVKTRDGEPNNPFILYDGGEHATFYRSEHETVLFDYLNEKVIPLLQEAEKAIIFEIDDDLQEVVKDYEVYVKHVKKNAFTDDL